MKLLISEVEINNLLPDLLPADLGVEKVALQVTPGGIVVTGTYPALGFSVAFEMIWELALIPGGVAAHLRELKVAGWPAGKLRGLLLKLIRDAVADRPGVHVEGEHARINVAEILASHKLKATFEITAIRSSDGVLEVEAEVRGDTIRDAS